MHPMLTEALAYARRASESTRNAIDVQEYAEEILLEDIEHAHASGDLTAEELLALWHEYRAFARPGAGKRWAELGLPNANALRTLMTNQPNGANGTWHGPARLTAQTPAPPRGLAVVYTLRDEDGAVVYIGSTGDLRTRLRAHRHTGKMFDHWTAAPAKDRADAYRLEQAKLLEWMPPLNRTRAVSASSPSDTFSPSGSTQRVTPQ